MSNEQSIYSVLYFEDEPGNFDSLARIKYNLDVHYASSAKEGLMLLEDNPRRWDAIILDANMPYEEGDAASIESLIRVERKIGSLSGESIPFFVYSARGTELRPFLHKEYWQQQAVFDKNDPNSFDELCKNICQAVQENKTISAITKRKYPEVSSVTQLNCDPPTENDLINIVKTLEIPRTPNYDPDRDDTIYNRIRVVLEWFFRYLFSKGIISEVPTTTNISACSRQLSRNWRVPIYVQRSVHSLVDNCNEGSHGTAIREDTKNGVCPYAIRSTVYDLLNVLHWSLSL